MRLNEAGERGKNKNENTTGIEPGISCPHLAPAKAAVTPPAPAALVGARLEGLLVAEPAVVPAGIKQVT